MPRLTTRLPGCAFLGAKAAEIKVSINGFDDYLKLIFDSSSDITLISERALRALHNAPRIRQGQRINLIQVTGKATISGYMPLKLYFHTPQGPVTITVEAYVVKGMSTPLILGNDFADQYALSLIRREDRTFLSFGSTDRELEVSNSISSPFIDEDGHAFSLRVSSTTSQSSFINRQKSKCSRRWCTVNKGRVVASERTIIPLLSSKCIQVQADFQQGVCSLFVERQFHSNGHPDKIYGVPNTLVDKERPFLHITNFSSVPIVVPQGQVLSKGAHNPGTWLNKNLCNPNAVKAATLIRLLVQLQTVQTSSEVTSKAQRNATGEGLDGEEPIEGGPKTAETAADTVTSSNLLTEIHISPDLTELQREQVSAVVLKNAQAFGLDGWLGNHPGLVDITLKPGTQPVSLPPYSASPAN